MKKNYIYFMLTLISLSVLFSSCTRSSKRIDNSNAENIVSRFITTRYFSNEEIPEADITKILNAGINAESASNKQPWHFTAVTSKESLREILETVNARRERNGQKLLAEPQEGKAVETNIANVPLLIIVSCDKGQELNAGLATQSMAIMAQVLGYGAKVETSPAAAITEKLDVFAEKLGIPEGKQPATVIKIGKIDTSITSELDGFSNPTPRNLFEEMTTLVK